jgi:hypothetical protein
VLVEHHCLHEFLLAVFCEGRTLRVSRAHKRERSGR